MSTKKLVYGYTSDSGQHEATVVTVRFDPKDNREAVNQRVTEALAVEKKTAGRQLKLLAEVGIPDITVVLDVTLEVAGVFVRNCMEDPLVEVIDINAMVGDPSNPKEVMAAQNRVDKELSEAGFRFLPHNAR